MSIEITKQRNGGYRAHLWKTTFLILNFLCFRYTHIDRLVYPPGFITWGQICPTADPKGHIYPTEEPRGYICPTAELQRSYLPFSRTQGHICPKAEPRGSYLPNSRTPEVISTLQKNQRGLICPTAETRGHSFPTAEPMGHSFPTGRVSRSCLSGCLSCTI